MTLICLKCNVPLESGRVTVQYMDSAFPVELPRCPQCGLVYVPETLAIGKMLDVEKALEDK
jgi:hypothetical protein